jgi:hypothetical protein
VTIKLRRYSGFPPELFERGLAARLHDCSLRLYILLCRESDRASSRRMSFSDQYARAQANISGTSMRNARKQLQAVGLVACLRDVGQQYSYELCDIDTGKPYDCDPKATPWRSVGPSDQGSARDRGRRSDSASLGNALPFSQPCTSPSGERVYFGIEDGTEFPFGGNAE